MNLLSKDKLRQWLLMAVFSAILVPIAVFLGGLLVAGSYEGEAGFFGLTGGIYADVMSGSLSALILLFSPLLLVLVWQLAGTAHRAISNHQRSAQADHAEADT